MKQVDGTPLPDHAGPIPAILRKIATARSISRDAGTGGAAAPVALYQEGQGGQRCPFNLKDCLGEMPELLVQFFYEFASENARNAVIELQE